MMVPWLSPLFRNKPLRTKFSKTVNQSLDLTAAQLESLSRVNLANAPIADVLNKLELFQLLGAHSQ